MEDSATMAHYEYGGEPLKRVECGRCHKLHDLRPYVWYLQNIEQPVPVEGKGMVWLCHECSHIALGAIFASMTDRQRVRALQVAGITHCGEVHEG